MRIVHTPTDFPDVTEFRLIGESVQSPFLLTILNKIRPRARCLGVSSPAEALNGEVPLLLYTPDWPSRLAALRERGVPEEAILVMPLPVGDVWAYWEFLRKDDNVEHLSADGSLARDWPDIWQNHIVPEGRKADNLQWSYLYTFRDALDERAATSIQTVCDHLSDERSRIIYDIVTREPPPASWAVYSRSLCRHLQYFDYVSLSPGDVILNGGVHTGFEIPFFLAHLDGKGALINFDPLGYDYLSDYAKAGIEHFGPIAREERLAISNVEGTISLPVDDEQVAGKGIYDAVGSRYADFDDVAFAEFPSMRIDRYVEANGLDRVDLIKLDLEGGEEHALAGAVETIRTFRPQLAISIYHLNEHFWTLPLALMRLCRNYRFYVSLYSYQRYECLFYAIPEERVC